MTTNYLYKFQNAGRGGTEATGEGRGDCLAGSLTDGQRVDEGWTSGSIQLIAMYLQLSMYLYLYLYLCVYLYVQLYLCLWLSACDARVLCFNCAISHISSVIIYSSQHK